MQVEADVLDHALAGQAADGQDHLADLGVLLREQVGQLATDHQRDELLAVQLGRGQGRDVLARRGTP